MKRFARWLAVAFAIVATLVAMPSHFATAQPTPDVSLKLDTDEAQVGDPITVTLSAMGDTGAPQATDPTFKVPGSFHISGPVVSTQTQMSIMNGRITQKSGMRATWQIVGTTPGTFEIGPVTVSVGGKKMSGGKVHVTIRPPGSGLRRKQPNNPFDPFGGLFPFGNMPDLDDSAPLDTGAPLDPQLGMDAPLEPQAFLRTIVDKPRAMVGEQVTASVYLYTQPRVFQILDPHEPTAVDFFQRSLSGSESEVKSVAIGATRWTVQLVRRIALFPLHAGNLEIGPMSLTLIGPGLRGGGVRGGMVRESKVALVQVSEPPAAGRPAGYTLGDVGSYTLTATVEPRAVETGGSIAVTVLLRGTGNVPTSLRLPERRGVTWLEPEMRESIDTTGNVVSGSRTFVYVVKMSEAGNVDLGAITLPYFDPKAKSYQTAQVSLGSVRVTGAAPAPAASVTRDPFAALAPARTTLRPYTAAASPMTDAPWFWGLLGGAPLSVLVLEGLTRGMRAARASRQERQESAGTKVREALAEATASEAAKDGKRAASAVERAVVVAVDDATGVKIRGLLREEVKGALVAAGLSDADAGEVETILRACDAWRFLPGESPSAEEHPTKRAAALAKRLGKWKKP